MANLKASKKYIPINKRNRERNVNFKSALKTRIKQALEAISSNKEDKLGIVKLALKTIAKVRQKGIIHKNYANRMKSNLSLKLNQEPKKPVEAAPEKTKAKTKKEA
ncbi:30S ribosomal protein S20, partial [Candidatus Marinamargulisbacteria bacterium SCGC AAA071-K20]